MSTGVACIFDRVVKGLLKIRAKDTSTVGSPGL